MTEISYFWDGLVTGDAAAAPYSSSVLSDVFRYMFTKDRTMQGYISGVLNELEVSGAGSPLAVETGAALVDGKFYLNDAVVNIVVASPLVDTRVDRVVLQKDFVNQTVRLALIAGVEGGAAPALTQTDGVIWEIPLAQVSITTLGVITVTDERQQVKAAVGSGAQVFEVQVFS